MPESDWAASTGRASDRKLSKLRSTSWRDAVRSQAEGRSVARPSHARFSMSAGNLRRVEPVPQMISRAGARFLINSWSFWAHAAQNADDRVGMRFLVMSEAAQGAYKSCPRHAVGTLQRIEER